MRSADIEAWALAVIDQVANGQPNEDSRVELKANWINPLPAARRIAGHANAARGAAILWLIGVDENNGVAGVNHKELANWWSQVKAEFQAQHAPALVDLNIAVANNKTVVALYFETDRAPYLIKVPGVTPSTYEVPWREATAVRSATHADLIRLLYPITGLPEIEVIRAFIDASVPNVPTPALALELHFRVLLYVMPQTERSVAIPKHRCHGSIHFVSGQQTIPFTEVELRPGEYTTPPNRPGVRGYGDYSTIHVSGEEALLKSASYLVAQGQLMLPQLPADIGNDDAVLSLSLRPALEDAAAVVTVALARRSDSTILKPEPGRAAQWFYIEH